MIGPSRNPDSSIQVVPVISPLPFCENHPAKTGELSRRPRGRIAVTPVRTGPSPTTSFPSPRMIVRCPTSTPATSVMALMRPGVPANAIPRSRARAFDLARGFACRDFLIALTDSRLKIEVIEEIRQARETTTMAQLLVGKSAIITGGGSGIGRAASLIFAREGARVMVADVAEPGGRETVEMIRGVGGEAHFQRCDVAN